MSSSSGLLCDMELGSAFWWWYHTGALTGAYECVIITKKLQEIPYVIL